MKKQKILLIIIGVILIVIIGGSLAYYLISKPGMSESGNILIELTPGGAWPGPKTIICRDGKFFSGNALMGILKNDAISLLKNKFGPRSIESQYSTDSQGASSDIVIFDAYSSYDFRYYAGLPVEKMTGSVVSYEKAGGEFDHISRNGDWEKLENFNSIISQVGSAINNKTKKIEAMLINPSPIINAHQFIFTAIPWMYDDNLFLFNNDEYYSFPNTKSVFADWPVLNEKQLSVINSIEIQNNLKDSKEYSYYFVRQNELFRMDVNKWDGKLYFWPLVGYKNLLPIEKLKEIDEDLYNTFVNDVNSSKTGKDNYNFKYVELSAGNMHKYDQLQGQEYFYINKDNKYYLLSVQFKKRTIDQADISNGKPIVNPYKDIQDSNELCAVKIDKSKIPNISAEDITSAK
jgi:hypothetical protein